MTLISKQDEAVIISILTNKGGVGKTTIVSNLAAALSDQSPDHKILIIDLDAQGNCTSTFHPNSHQIEVDMHDVMLGNVDIQDIIIEIKPNLHIAPSHEKLDLLAFEVLTNLDKYGHPFLLLKNKIEKLRDRYTHIFIDTPPALDLIAGNILATTDYVVLPFNPEKYAVKGLMRVVKHIEKFKEHNPSLKLAGIVATLVDSRTVLHSQMLQQARKFCHHEQLPMYEAVISRSIRNADAVAYEDKPAVWVDKSHPAAITYYNLLSEVLNSVET